MKIRSLFVGLFILVSQPSYSQTENLEFYKILKCQTPLDGTYQQGEAVRIDIFYNPTNEKSYIVSRPDLGPEVQLLLNEESQSSVINIKNSSLYFSWAINEIEKPYASLVYIGHWVLAMDITSTMIQRDPSLSIHNEVTLFCDETQKFIDFFIPQTTDLN